MKLPGYQLPCTVALGAVQTGGQDSGKICSKGNCKAAAPIVFECLRLSWLKEEDGRPTRCSSQLQYKVPLV